MRPTWEKSQAARFPSAGHWSSPPIGPLARTQLNSPNPLPPSTAGSWLCMRTLQPISSPGFSGLSEVFPGWFIHRFIEVLQQRLDRLAFTQAE